MTVELYVFENANGEPDSYSTFSAQEAREYATRYGLKWLAQIFEYTDTDLVEDHTGTQTEGRDAD